MNKPADIIMYEPDTAEERMDVALGTKLDVAAAAARLAFYTSSDSPVQTTVPYEVLPESHKVMWRAVATAARDAFGTVVLTRDPRTDELVAVTRQDDDGRVLSVIWQRGT